MKLMKTLSTIWRLLTTDNPSKNDPSKTAQTPLPQNVKPLLQLLKKTLERLSPENVTWMLRLLERLVPQKAKPLLKIVERLLRKLLE